MAAGSAFGGYPRSNDNLPGAEPMISTSNEIWPKAADKPAALGLPRLEQFTEIEFLPKGLGVAKS